MMYSSEAVEQSGRETDRIQAHVAEDPLQRRSALAAVPQPAAGDKHFVGIAAHAQGPQLMRLHGRLKVFRARRPVQVFYERQINSHVAAGVQIDDANSV